QNMSTSATSSFTRDCSSKRRSPSCGKSSVYYFSLWKVVRDNLHKAFWDILESELNDDPPEYGQAIRLLEEIREILLSFLNPDANRMRTQIMEVLDMDLIRQQADNDAVDIHGLSSYIPTTTDNILIFCVLDLMKMYTPNFTYNVFISHKNINCFYQLFCKRVFI
uniref:Uncharacterized protein n=1 Tax=Echeneis naucrates TaxID=173247 RepID=A0A665WHA3_ECHNA